MCDCPELLKTRAFYYYHTTTTTTTITTTTTRLRVDSWPVAVLQYYEKAEKHIKFTWLLDLFAIWWYYNDLEFECL